MSSYHSLRGIKKDIEYCVGAFVDDCALFLTVHPGKQAEEITGLIDKAVDLFNDLRDKIGHPEGDKKAFYNGLRKEMLTQLDGLYDQLSEAVKKGISEK